MYQRCYETKSNELSYSQQVQQLAEVAYISKIFTAVILVGSFNNILNHEYSKMSFLLKLLSKLKVVIFLAAAGMYRLTLSDVCARTARSRRSQLLSEKEDTMNGSCD